MKLDIKSVLRAMIACSCAVWLAGCETEADDEPTVSTNVFVSTNVSVTATTNTSGTNAVNNQTVILNKIEPTLPPSVKLTKGVEEVVKLAQSGVSETVLLLFVEKAGHPYDLDATEILYLNDIGIPQTVIASMLNHDGASAELKNVLTTNQAEVAPVPPTAPGANLVAPAVQPATQVVEVSSNYVADPNYQPPVVQQEPIVVQQQPIVVQQPVIVQPAVTHSYFYSSLAPYGSWVEVADYGWCWQPTIAVVHRGWRPYAHGGRWLNSDHGWYWQSDYSWGWAPFHYGRWYSAPRHGWVWMPDYTWGPSWVTWRYSGNYCGWAPLPPRSYVRPGVGFSYWGRDVGFSFGFGLSHDHYTFIPTRRFHERRVMDHVIPTERTGNIYKDSTIVNNYIVGNNNTIINNGIGRDRIVSHTRTEIPRVKVQETSGTPGTAVQPDRVRRSGNDLVVYRPKAPPIPADAAGQRGEVGNRGNQESRRFAETPAANSRLGQETRRNEPVTAAAAGNRSATVRPQISARSEPPVFGTPEPVRPEPAPTFTPRVQSSRAVQESHTRSEVPVTAGRPQPPPLTSTQPAAGTSRNETVSRGTSSRFGNQPAMPPSISGQTVPGVVNPGNTVARPVTPTQNSRFGSTPAMPPSISGQQVPGAPPTRTESRFGRTDLNRQSATANPAPQVVVPQQPRTTIERTPGGNSRFGSPPPAAAPDPTVIRRSETFTRPSTPAQQNPPPPVMQPRTITPVNPTRSAPPSSSGPNSRFGGSQPPNVSSAPSGGNSRFGGSPPPGVNSAPSGGNSRFNSAPPAAAPAPRVIERPQSSRQEQAPSGRGRVEIGR